LITRKTEFSLPGISEDASSTTSPGPALMTGCSWFEIRDSALNGSPWDPVEMMTTLFSG